LFLQKEAKKRELERQMEERRKQALAGIFSWEAFYTDKLEILPETGEPLTIEQALKRKSVYRNERRMKQLHKEKQRAVMVQLVREEKKKLKEEQNKNKFKKNLINRNSKSFMKPVRKGHAIDKVAPRYEKMIIKDYKKYEKRFDTEKEREKQWYDKQERSKSTTEKVVSQQSTI